MLPHTLRACAALAVVLALLAPAREAEANEGGPFGLGIIVGGPTGLTGKYWLSRENAIDFHLGLSGLGNDRHTSVGLYGDYLWNFELTRASVFGLYLYVGPGVSLIFSDDDYCGTIGDCRDDDDDLYLAVRVPVGLSFKFTNFPGEAFIELTSSLFLIPGTFFDIDPAIGFRFYF